jgi:hypothetical protein
MAFYGTTSRSPALQKFFGSFFQKRTASAFRQPRFALLHRSRLLTA